MNIKQPAGNDTGAQPDGPPVPPAVVVTAHSLPLGRRLGPLTWMALQYLAVSAQRSDQGWAAATGVRHVAGGIGVSKDTAARAISRLVTAGLVTRAQVEAPDGRRRSGYLLHLPDEIGLIDCPTDLDTSNDRRPARPHREYSRRPPSRRPGCPEGEYTPDHVETAQPVSEPVVRWTAGTQRSLFDERPLANRRTPSSPAAASAGGTHG